MIMCSVSEGFWEVGEMLQQSVVESQEVACKQLVKKPMAGSIYIQACFKLNSLLYDHF
jgi:hypothetical protein